MCPHLESLYAKPRTGGKKRARGAYELKQAMDSQEKKLAKIAHGQVRAKPVQLLAEPMVCTETVCTEPAVCTAPVSPLSPLSASPSKLSPSKLSAEEVLCLFHMSGHVPNGKTVPADQGNAHGGGAHGGPTAAARAQVDAELAGAYAA